MMQLFLVSRAGLSLRRRHARGATDATGWADLTVRLLAVRGAGDIQQALAQVRRAAQVQVDAARHISPLTGLFCRMSTTFMLLMMFVFGSVGSSLILSVRWCCTQSGRLPWRFLSAALLAVLRTHVRRRRPAGDSHRSLVGSSGGALCIVSFCFVSDGIVACSALRLAPTTACGYRRALLDRVLLVLRVHASS